MRSQMGAPLNTEVNMKWRVLSGPPLCQPLFHYLLLVRNCNIVFFFSFIVPKGTIKKSSSQRGSKPPSCFFILFFFLLFAFLKY